MVKVCTCRLSQQHASVLGDNLRRGASEQGPCASAEGVRRGYRLRDYGGGKQAPDVVDDIAASRPLLVVAAVAFSASMTAKASG